MRRGGAALLLAGAGLAGCERLPEVDPSAFACVDDQPLEDGRFPCGASHWCVEGACAPRLGCGVVSTERGPAACNDPGADPETDPIRRCEPVLTPEVAAVRCERGIATSTTARPEDPVACDCPDGLHCVAWIGLPDPDDPEEGFLPSLDLRLLPSGGPRLPREVEAGRLCVRACSAEGNCPAAHTCRPALVERGRPPGSRDTVAVCYPDIVPSTSTTSPAPQPLPRACLRDADCDDATCRYDVVRVPDHPAVALGEVWDHGAVAAACGPGVDPDPGQTCTVGRECASGICIRSRCRVPCDPASPAVPCRRRRCVAEAVARRTTDRTVRDRVFVCER